MIEKIAFEHIIHKMDSQRADLQNIRNQAAISAAVTGLVASVFSSLTGEGFLEKSFFVEGCFWFSIPAILLIITFVGAILSAAWVLIGFSNVTFSFNTRVMLELKTDLQSETEFFAHYIEDGESFFDGNENKINKAQNMLRISIALGCCQFIPWLILLRGT